jgi:putative hemolysin
LVEELVGDIRDEYDSGSASTTALAGGDVEVDGLLNLDDFVDETGIRLPDGPYETAAGFVMASLGRVPQIGDIVDVGDRSVEVVAMDGRRIARLRVTPPRLATRSALRDGDGEGPYGPGSGSNPSRHA